MMLLLKITVCRHPFRYTVVPEQIALHLHYRATKFSFSDILRFLGIWKRVRRGNVV